MQEAIVVTLLAIMAGCLFSLPYLVPNCTSVMERIEGVNNMLLLPHYLILLEN